MTEFIEIDGVQHPVSFANAALIIYEDEYGRPMMGDYNKVVESVAAMNRGDFSQPYAGPLAHLVYMGVKNGYRERGEPCPLTNYFDVAGILNDMEIVSKVIIMMTSALVKTTSKEKKTTPPMKAAKRKAA